MFANIEFLILRIYAMYESEEKWFSYWLNWECFYHFRNVPYKVFARWNNSLAYTSQRCYAYYYLGMHEIQSDMRLLLFCVFYSVGDFRDQNMSAM